MNFQKELIEAGYNSIILLRNEMGAGKPGAGSGAEKLASVLLKNEELKELRLIQSTILKQVDSKLKDFPAKYIDQMVQIAVENATLLEEGLQNGSCFILSGDHSNAAGSIAGLVKANPHANVGVIWIDAHADLHTPFTTPSGNFHGMPLAALLGIERIGKNSLLINDAQTQLWHQYLLVSGKKPTILPSNLVYIAVRSTEPEEDIEILKNGILKISVSELNDTGVKSVIDKTLHHLESCDLIYISFDIDSLDSSIVSGTGTPVNGGLSADEAIQLLRPLVFHPKTKAFEITEVNPSLDIKPQSVIETATHILNQIFNK